MSQTYTFGTEDLYNKVSEYEIKNKVLEENLDEMTRSYATQFAKIKSQLTEQGARLLINEQQDARL